MLSHDNGGTSETGTVPVGTDGRAGADAHVDPDAGAGTPTDGPRREGDQRILGSILIANRGEIAVRIIRTVQRMGLTAVACFSDADVGALHVRMADRAVRLGPAPAADSYLDVARVVAAAQRAGADAIHPGYGFLSENPALARACAAAELVFIGPGVAALETMGDKIAAKRTVAAAGVPVVPGRHDEQMSDAALAAAVGEVGFPALLKPSAGGGGKGMRVVREPSEVPAAISAARREATGSFGDDTLLVERYVERPRHIEVQVLADAHGSIIHLGERECSLQRRHQKVIEEAPSVLLTARTRERMGAAAVAVAAACDYVGAGTVEFLVDSGDPEQFYFLEMNTRLQVEHPATEMVTGIDLVEQQVEVSRGRRLALTQDDVRLEGHAIEARVYAEDVPAGFLPSAGELVVVREPAARGVRVDSGVSAGDRIGTDYDPMLAKVIAHGRDRNESLARLRTALSRTAYLGVSTNVAHLARLLDSPAVIAGDLHTGLVDELVDLMVQEDLAEEAVAAVVAERIMSTPVAGVGPWRRRDGWRLGEPAWVRWQLRAGPRRLALAARASGWDGDTVALEYRVDAGPVRRAGAEPDGRDLLLTSRGQIHRFRTARQDEILWLSQGSRTWRLVEQNHRLDADTVPGSAVLEPIRSPMPGSIVAVQVEGGQAVVAGQPIITVEAMKMEHPLLAPADATVAGVAVGIGDRVSLDQVLVTFDPRTAERSDGP